MINDMISNTSGDELNGFESLDDLNSQFDDDNISNSNFDLSDSQEPDQISYRYHYPLNKENTSQPQKQQQTEQVYNPYDFTNPETLISVKIDNSNDIDILVRKYESTAQVDSIIHSFTLNETEAYELESLTNPQTVIPLDADYFSNDFYNNEIYQLKVQSKELPRIDDIYDEMKISNVKVPPNLLPEVLFKKMMNFTDKKIEYNRNFFLRVIHRFLTRMIIDISKGESFIFLRSLLMYLSPETELHHEFPFLVTNVLIDSISTLFVEVPSFYFKRMYSASEHLTPDNSDCYPFVHLLAELIIRHQVPYDSVRKSIGVFRPSLVSEQLIFMLAANFLTVLPVHETFKICSELFGDKWLFHAFRNPSIMPMIAMKPDNSQVFPFLYIYAIFSRYFKAELSINTTLAMVESIGEKSIFDSKRILKTFLDTYIEIIYKKFIDLKNDPGYLELTKFQKEAISLDLELNLPVFKTCIRNKEVMIALLDRLKLLFMRHDYLPKGLPFLFYSFLINNGICSPAAFNIWFESICAPKNSPPCSSGILLELNTLINGAIPSESSFDKLIDLPIPDQVNKDLNDML